MTKATRYKKFVFTGGGRVSAKRVRTRTMRQTNQKIKKRYRTRDLRQRRYAMTNQEHLPLIIVSESEFLVNSAPPHMGYGAVFEMAESPVRPTDRSTYRPGSNAHTLTRQLDQLQTIMLDEFIPWSCVATSTDIPSLTPLV